MEETAKSNQNQKNIKETVLDRKLALYLLDNKLEKKETTIEQNGKKIIQKIYSLTIPQEFEYKGNKYKIIAIGDNAFSDCVNLTEITIPNSVQEIGRFAFGCCYSLKTVKIDKEKSNLKIIKCKAFSNCRNLTEITIPNSVEEIEDNAFNSCRSLINVKIDTEKSNLQSIGNNIFDDCELLNEFKIPNKVTHIKPNAFTKTNFSPTLGDYSPKCFGGIEHIYYDGTAKGSPWGAAQHIKK